MNESDHMWDKGIENGLNGDRFDWNSEVELKEFDRCDSIC